ncbi:putative SlyX protein [Acinetobacter baumannii ABNIH1]|nr:putative SlyX protein [Acinetobacter baumannii ABNIH1]
MTKPPYHDDQASFSAPIEDLQVRIAFLDDLVEELNQQLAIQTLEIADLKNKCNYFINVWNLQIYQKVLHLLIH